MNYLPFVLVMAITTYLLRAVPLTLFRGKIKSRFVRSLLFYIPCACLSAMTFPAILVSSGNLYAGLVSLAIAIFLSCKGKGLATVLVLSCVAFYAVQLLCSL